MTFTGWTLAQIGTLFAIGALAITGLYLLRMRRRQVVVPFAALWQNVTRESESRQLWRRLRRLFSWFLQLLILALFCIALGDPRPEVWLREPVTLALVIDHSASMAGPVETSSAGSQTRLEQALERARAEIAAMGPADRTLIIAAGPEVTTLAPLSREPSALLKNLEQLQPVSGEADLRQALELATNAIAGQPGPRILVLSDGAVDDAGLRAFKICSENKINCKIKHLDGPSANVAITAFAARRYPSDREHMEVLTEVQNLGDEPVQFTLEITADDVRLGAKELSLAAGERKQEILSNLDVVRTQLRAQLSASANEQAKLGPTNDDLAYAVVPPQRPLQVGLITDGSDLFLEAALLVLDDHIQLKGFTPQQASSQISELADMDLVIVDVGGNLLPNPLPATNLALFDPGRLANAPSPIPIKQNLNRPFLTEQLQAHPLLENIVFKDVNIARGTSFVLQAGDQALVRSLGEAIIVLRSGTHSILAIGFDPRQSDFPLRVAFPLFIANIIVYFDQSIPGFVASVPIGAHQALAAAGIGLRPDGLTLVEVTGPENDPEHLRQELATVHQGVFRLRALRPGFYRITARDGEGADSSVLIAVNQASAAASNLHSRLSELQLPAQAWASSAPDSAPLTRGPLWTWFVLLAAALLIVEWASYHRRQTV